MKTSFGVIWTNGDGEARPARLHVEPAAIVLVPLDGQGVPREVPLEDLAALELRGSAAGDADRATLDLKLRSGDVIELRSNVDRWIAAHLLERLFAHGLGATERVLVAARLKPGSRERARELLRAGPPFAPEATPLVLHEVYLLEDEALFLLVTEDADAGELIAESDFWAAAGAWRALLAGEIRLAERVYAWSREERTPHELHFGLGY